MPGLVYYDHDERKVYEMKEDQPVLIGRSKKCQIHLSGYTNISRQHCRIFYSPQQRTFVVADLESTNGSFLNGMRVHEGEALKHNDELRVGDVHFVFYEDINDVQDLKTSTGTGKIAQAVKSFSMDDLASPDKTDIYQIQSPTFEELLKKTKMLRKKKEEKGD